MRTLIVYMSKHGCSEKAATLIQRHLDDPDVQVVNLARNPTIDPSPFEGVIIGGPVYLGALQKRLTRFCERHRQVLVKKHLGLFICCMNMGDAARRHFETVYDAELRDAAAAVGLFGGELNFETLGPMEKAIIGQVVSITESVSRFDEETVKDFALRFAGRQSKNN